MRTISEIIIDAKDGKVPTHEECYYALLAYAGRMHFWRRDLEAIAEASAIVAGEGEPSRVGQQNLKLQLALRASPNQIARDWEGFLKADPKTWLGPMSDPLSEEGKAWIKTANAIWDKATAQAEQRSALSKRENFKRGD